MQGFNNIVNLYGQTCVARKQITVISQLQMVFSMYPDILILDASTCLGFPTDYWLKVLLDKKKRKALWWETTAARLAKRRWKNRSW